MPQEQEQKRIQKRGGGEGAESEDAGQVTSSTKGEKLKEEMDDILDEIDSVLEENAEEFVKSYVQKGGECPTRAGRSARTPASPTSCRPPVPRRRRTSR